MPNKRAVFLIKTRRPPYWGMAKMLNQKHGWEIYGFSPHILPEYMKEVCAGYLDLHTVIERAKAAPVPDDITSKSRRIEEEYNLNLADVIAPDRHMGIGWVTGGLYHRGELSYMSYEKHLHIIYEVFEAFDHFLQQVQPAFVCPGIVGSFLGATIYSVCKKKRIPIYGLSPLSYEAYYYWQREKSGQIPYLEETYQDLKISNGQLTELDNAITDIAPFTKSIISAMMEKGKLSNLLRRLFVISYKHARSAIAGNRKIGEVFLPAKLKYHLQNYLNFKKEMRREYPPIGEIAKMDYVYYPLHYEPEASLNGVEPHFTNQMYAIELLSKSVPAGGHVLVKEHPAAVGNRPLHWMDAIAEFPRVKLVHPFENSIELIRHSMATATITGTAGLEAAILGKPVISLGPNYRFNFVDHVFFANDLPSLRILLEWIYENRKSLDFRENGAVLKRAIELTCFKLDVADFYSYRPSDSSIETVCNELLKLINKEQPAQAFFATG